MVSQCPEPSHLRILHLELRPKLTNTLTRTRRVRGARHLKERRTQVAADTTVSVLLIETTLWASTDLRNDMYGLSARPYNCEGQGTIERAHLKIHLNSRRVHTAAATTGPHPRHRQSVGTFFRFGRQSW